eukprot:gene1344-1484_t
MHRSQETDNSVNGTISLDIGASLSKVDHVRQVVPDRHHTTVLNKDIVRIVYAPTSESSEEAIIEFYNMLEETKSQCKSQDIIMVMGDLNAKHPRRLWTWKSPGGHYKNQIDFITINNHFRNAVQQTKTYPGADCGSDHQLLFCKLKVKLKKFGTRYELLKNDPIVRQMYAVTVKNRFESLAVEEVCKWNALKKALVTSAEQVIPKRETLSKQKCMTDEILNLMKKRQSIVNRESQECKDADRFIKYKCRVEKDAWFNKKCEEIEMYEKSNPTADPQKFPTRDSFAHMLEEEFNSGAAIAKSKKRQLSNSDVAQFIREINVKTYAELLAIAESRKDEGLDDIADFAFSRSEKHLRELVTKTWFMKDAPDKVKGIKTSRMEKVREALDKECTPNCNKEWY